MQLLTNEIRDFGEVLPDDTLRAMDLTETPPIEECFKLPVHAVIRTKEVEVVRLRALVRN